MLAMIATALVYVRRQKAGRVKHSAGPGRLARLEGRNRAASRPRRACRPRPVHSDEPPTLILLRDHFGVVVAMSLTVASCLFGFLMVVIRGTQKQA